MAEHAYWKQDGPDRLEFLRRFIAKLRGGSWQTRLDTGWGHYDLEVSKGPWARLRLTSVTEDLEQGKRVYRFRLERTWSARGWLLFGTATGAVLAAIGWLASSIPLVWALLLVPAALLWYLDDEGMGEHAAFQALLDGAASDSGCVRIDL
jgi:hypothetical protein